MKDEELTKHEKTKRSSRPQGVFPPSPLAYKHKKITGIVTEGSEVVRERAVHKVRKARKISHPAKLRYLKPYGQEQLSSGTHEIEAASADIYRYLLGPHRAPKSRAVVGHAALSGVLSTEVTGGFTAFSDFIDKDLEGDPSRVSASDLSSRGFGSLLAANYLMQENDCHWGNFGFNGEGKLSRIDFDQSMAPVTFPSHNAVDFLIADSTHDLLHLTHPEDFKPYNSPLYLAQGKTTEFDFRNTPLGKDLAAIEDNDPSFQMDKWKTIVKAGLLSLDMIKKIFSAHLSEQADIDLYASLLYDRFQTIKNTMMKLPEFEAFFSRQGAEMIAEVEREVDEYNQEFNKKYAERKVVVVPRELEEHYREHFNPKEQLEIIEKLRKFSEEMLLKIDMDSFVVGKRRALQKKGNALLLSCREIMKSIADKETLEKMNGAISEVVDGLRRCASMVSEESVELRSEHENLLKIIDGFSVLQGEVVEKINASVSSTQAGDPVLSQRVARLIMQLERYIKETIAAYEGRADQKEKVRLATHLRSLLMHETPKSEESFHKHIDVFVKAAEQDDKLKSILEEARTATSLETPPEPTPVLPEDYLGESLFAAEVVYEETYEKTGSYLSAWEAAAEWYGPILENLKSLAASDPRREQQYRMCLGRLLEAAVDVGEQQGGQVHEQVLALLTKMPITPEVQREIYFDVYLLSADTVFEEVYAQTGSHLLAWKEAEKWYEPILSDLSALKAGGESFTYNQFQERKQAMEAELSHLFGPLLGQRIEASAVLVNVEGVMKLDSSQPRGDLSEVDLMRADLLLRLNAYRLSVEQRPLIQKRGRLDFVSASRAENRAQKQKLIGELIEKIKEEGVDMVALFSRASVKQMLAKGNTRNTELGNILKEVEEAVAHLAPRVCPLPTPLAKAPSLPAAPPVAASPKASDRPKT